MYKVLRTYQMAFMHRKSTMGGFGATFFYQLLNNARNREHFLRGILLIALLVYSSAKPGGGGKRPKEVFGALFQ
jgi:hypothetical protein